jgi:hypothetical protein
MALSINVGEVVDFTLSCRGDESFDYTNWQTKITFETNSAWTGHLPIGPQFTDTQKSAQRLSGNTILQNIRNASAQGLGSYTIPPGDYRFSGDCGKNPVLDGLHDADK